MTFDKSFFFFYYFHLHHLDNEGVGVKVSFLEAFIAPRFNDFRDSINASDKNPYSTYLKENDKNS